MFSQSTRIYFKKVFYISIIIPYCTLYIEKTIVQLSELSLKLLVKEFDQGYLVVYLPNPFNLL